MQNFRQASFFCFIFWIHCQTSSFVWLFGLWHLAACSRSNKRSRRCLRASVPDSSAPSKNTRKYKTSFKGLEISTITYSEGLNFKSHFWRVYGGRKKNQKFSRKRFNGFRWNMSWTSMRPFSGNFWKNYWQQLKARSQEPVVRLKTRRRILLSKQWRHTSNFKVRRLENKKYSEEVLSKKDWNSVNDFFPKIIIFWEKKTKIHFFFLKNPCSLKLELP